jgi:FHA domain
MTTEAPLGTADPTGQPLLEEQKTAPLAAPENQPALDSFGLLDHRARGRAIPRRLAPFGQYLAFADGDDKWLVALDAKVTHLGRGLAADVRIEDQRVSRSHAILVRHGHRTRLLDNRSANGTFVNGRQVIATNIADGDVIRLGPVVMTYVRVS